VLQQDAVAVRVGVQCLDAGEQLVRGRCAGQLDGARSHAHAGAGVLFHPHIGGGGGIIADEDGGEDRATTAVGGDQLCHTTGDFRFGLRCQCLAVQYHCGHSVTSDRLRGHFVTGGARAEAKRQRGW